jgi:hypothetical protein
MTTTPDQIRREIEQTQRGLSADVDALTEKVTPRRIMARRMSKARRAFVSMRDTVMGTTSDTVGTASDRMSSAAGTVADTTSSAASSAAQTLTDAPQAIRRQTEGNPLAAGLIAFGLGWLTASLLPPSQREQELADQAKELAREHVQPAVTEAAGQVRDNLQEPAKQAVESVKSTAQDAGSTVADQARDAKENVKQQTGSESRSF